MDEVRLGSRTLQPRRQLLAGNDREPLGKRALDIISVLAEAGGGIVTKDELFEAVWPGVIVEENALQVQIVALRKALGPEANRLQTIRGVGYRLEVDDVPDEPSADPGAARASRSTNVSSGALLRALWPKARAPRLVLALAGLLFVLAGVWAAFGSQLGQQPHGRISVVVHVLAVGPNGGPAEARLATGITDELILRLRRVPELRVATASPDGTVRSEDFDNAYVVDGNIRQSGDQLRVTARLIDAKGEILWSETFDRNLGDLFDVQERIAASIADELSVSLDVGVDSRSYGGTDNPEAFANYVQGTSRLFDGEGSMASAYLERAVELDPGYVKALAALSDAYGFSRNQTSSRQDDYDRLRKQGVASASALRANPDIWQGHAARSFYELGRGNLPAAKEHYLRAVALDPGNDPQARDALANLASEFGSIRKTVEFRRSKGIIDPFYRNDSRLVGDLVLAGRYAEAKRLFETLSQESLAVHPGVAVDAFWAYLLLGDADRARELADQEILFPPYSRVPAFQFDPDDMPDPSAVDLRQWADSKFGEGGRPDLVFTALLVAHNGQQAEALEYLKLSYRRTGAYGYRFLWHPALADLRRTEGFRQLVTDLGLVEAWRKSGDWGDYCRPVSATEITCQ